MRLIGSMDGVCLERFLQAYALFRHGWRKILEQLIGQIHFDMPSRHSNLESRKAIGRIHRIVRPESAHHAIINK